MPLAELNRRFAIPEHISFVEGEGGLLMAEVDNKYATARIALQGAHLMTWQPKGQEPVVWLSKDARFAPGKSIRGGVPICWPWFGPHGTESSWPGHGFARTVMWEVMETRVFPDGNSYLRFGLIETEATRAQWPHPCSVQIEFSIGKTLGMALTTRNLGLKPFILGEALHTYFHISDVGQMTIRGLENTRYMDKAGGRSELCKQVNGIKIDGEVDRVYLNTKSDCIIKDRGLQRVIRIAKLGSNSTVVWNPWVEKAEKMGDLGPDGYRSMVCVESGNALDNVVSVAPGESHRMAVLYSLEDMD